jgi:hypothetical protein
MNHTETPHRNREAHSVCGLFIAVISMLTLTASGGERPLDEELRGYRGAEASGAAAMLNRRLEAGASKLDFDTTHGYLMALLRELKIPVSSQLLVASKTSPNKALISPKNPRAIYFNDEVSVAYVPSADLVELAVADPNLGVVFYTLSQQPAQRPRLIRDDRCLECHASAKTLNVPGLMVRSFSTRADGDVDILSGLVVTHRTPLAQRWGGYYVTGFQGDQSHRGNLFGGDMIARLNLGKNANGDLADLKTFLDTSHFPEAGSDLVALMTLEHQAHAQNLLTRLHYDTLTALEAGSNLRPAYPATEAALRYLLFVDEYRLASPVSGTSDFARQFTASGLRDSRGRSLREFDLQTRLFKHPCSYMIYSPTFNSLPTEAKKHFYRRLLEILDGQHSSADFAALSLESREAIRQILVETKPDLPADWRL